MNKKILLADRSSSLERTFVDALAGEAVEVMAVTDGYAADRCLNESPPDLVFADVFLLGKNGYELCQSIKQNPQLSRLPVILLVGSFEPFDAAEASRVGADGKLAKPIEPTGLVEMVRKFLGAGVQAAADMRDPVLTAIPGQVSAAGSPYTKVPQPPPSQTQPMGDRPSWEVAQPASTLCKNHPGVAAAARCAGCAEPFCANCLVEVHGQKYCGQCKVLALQGRTSVPVEATTPCQEANDALKYALIGLFCFGIYFGPKAISRAMKAKSMIDTDPMLTGSGKANAALVIGIIGTVLWVLGIVLRVSSIGSR